MLSILLQNFKIDSKLGPQHDAMKLFNDYDGDGDGRLDRIEFKKIMMTVSTSGQVPPTFVFHMLRNFAAYT